MPIISVPLPMVIRWIHADSACLQPLASLGAAMYKSIHSPQNQVFLALLRDYRRLRRLRQADVGDRLGKDQGMVSKVESGERRLDVIELRAWLYAIDVDFIAFMKELDARLSRL